MGKSGSGLTGWPRPGPGPGGCPCPSARRLHRLTQSPTCLNTGVIFTGLVGCREISLPEDPQYEGEGNFQGPRLADPHRHLPVNLRPPRDGGVRFRPEGAGRHGAGKHGLLRIKNQPAGWLSAVFASSSPTMAAVGRARTLMGRMIRGTSKMASKSTNPLPDDHQPEGAGAVGLHPCPLGRQI